jgi:hypothetical protein
MAYRRPNTEQAQASGSKAAGPDFCITYHGTVSTLDLLTDAARRWADANLEVEPWQWLTKRRLAIDPSIAEELREALTEAGFADGEEDKGGLSA